MPLFWSLESLGARIGASKVELPCLSLVTERAVAGRILYGLSCPTRLITDKPCEQSEEISTKKKRARDR